MMYIECVSCMCVNTFLTKYIQLSYLPSVKKVGPPVSVSCPVDRNVKDGECLPLVSVSKRWTSLLQIRMTFT